MNDLDDQAKKLWQARTTGTQCEPFSSELTISDAYDLQSACIRHAPNNNKIIGYKIGATVSEVLDMLSLDEPFYGAMYQSDLHQAVGSTPLDLPLFVQHQPRIEAEIAVCMKSDLTNTGQEISLDEVQAAVDWVSPGLEIVASRCETPEDKRGLFAIADFGANQHMVLGSPFSKWQELDLTAHAISININDETAVEGHSGMSIFGNPLQFVRWLVNHPSRRNVPLKAGEIVSCGTCTGALPIRGNDVVKAHFGLLGSLQLNIVAR